MNHELRILSGLHRGATLPLDEQELMIGASEESDVVLADPGLQQKHATLLATETGWCLSAVEGAIYSADSLESQTLLDIAPNTFARIGDVWVMLATEDAPWSDPPPLPTASDFPSAEELAAPDPDSDTEMHPSSDDAGVTETASKQTPVVYDEPPVPAARSRRNARLIYVPLAVGTVLSAAAAYAFTTSSETEPVPAAKRSWNAVSPAQGAQVSRPAVELTPEELRQAFRKRLADALLLNRFELNLKDGSWQMRAALDDEERARFERVLAGFVKAHRITFPIHAQVGSPEEMLPFKVRQVIASKNASIVTDDGRQLYIGDEYRGVRLLDVRDDQLVFAGKRKIEVPW